MMPAVDVGDDERPRRALDQIDGILQLSRVLIRSLLAKLDERNLVTVFGIDRILRISGGIRSQRRKRRARG